MLTNFFSAIPLGVFPLFFGLIWLGHRASRDREVSTTLIYALPLLALLSLNRALSLPESEAVLSAMIPAWTVGAFWGYRAQKHWAIRKSEGRVQLRGEYVTMGVLLGMFTVNFVAGALRDIAPEIIESLGFSLGFGGLSGVLSGTFFGRALRIARMPDSASVPENI